MSAMQRPVIMATLLKRSDAPLYRVYVGVDCAAFVQQLTQEHCFDVQAVLHAPSVTSDAQEQIYAAIQQLGSHKGKAWFQASLREAVVVFVAALPAELLPAEPLSVEPVASVPSPEAAPACETVTDPAYVAGSNETPSSLGSVAEDSDDAMDSDDLWSYVSTCSTREATKSADVRAALEEKLGKAQAQRILARTKPTVAQDPSGKKNRVLKLGGSYLKLK